MSAKFDLDDVAATSDLAQAELTRLRALNAELSAAGQRLLDVLDGQMPHSRRLEERTGPMGSLRAAITKAKEQP